jgi:hypothetical protein
MAASRVAMSGGEVLRIRSSLAIIAVGIDEAQLLSPAGLLEAPSMSTST